MESHRYGDDESDSFEDIECHTDVFGVGDEGEEDESGRQANHSPNDGEHGTMLGVVLGEVEACVLCRDCSCASKGGEWRWFLFWVRAPLSASETTF